MNTQDKIFEIMSHTRVQYPVETVLDMMSLYITTGNLRGSAIQTGVNHETAADWRRQQWFHDILALVKVEHQKKLEAKLTSLLEKSVKELEDRLTNGDVDSKTGLRRPIPGSQIASIISTLYDKRALIRGEPTSRVEKTSVEQRLNKLHQRFEQIGKQKPVLIEAERLEEDDE